MRGVYENAGVLWRDDGLDYGRDIVDVGEGFDAEQDVVEGSL